MQERHQNRNIYFKELSITSRNYFIPYIQCWHAIAAGMNVLEIGCGSGYQAMVLSKMFRRVFSIERIDKLFEEARERFRRLASHNIFIKLDDGQKGWAEYAPFDAILFSACAREIPTIIVNQLEEGGVLVAPMLENGKQIIKRFKKHNGILEGGEILSECLFVDIQDGIVSESKNKCVM